MRGGQGGGGDMDAGAAGGGVEDDAGEGVGVIGEAGALIGREGCGRVGVAGGEDGETAGGKGGAEAGREGEGDVLFLEVIGELRAGIGTAVGGVDDDDGALGGGFGLGVEGQAGEYAQSEGDEGEVTVGWV